MIIKNKLHYCSPWTILKFEKQGVSLVYNNITKEYDFYENSPKMKITKNKQKSSKFTPREYAFMAVTAILGISLAANIFAFLM
jgi:hypothetical protein